MLSDCKKEKQFYGYLALKIKVWTYVDLLKTNKTAKTGSITKMSSKNAFILQIGNEA